MGKLTVSGVVRGAIGANEVFANDAQIEGDIHATGSVKIGKGTVIIGDLYGTSAVIAGAVKGNIDIEGPVIVDSTAIVVGDMKFKTVQINNGATIEGRCSSATVMSIQRQCSRRILLQRQNKKQNRQRWQKKRICSKSQKTFNGRS